MANLLHLMHYLPYPPDKDDKVRSIQNAIRQEMSMTRPDLAADAPNDHMRTIKLQPQAPDRVVAIGAAARHCELQTYEWSAHMAVIERNLTGLGAGALAAA